MTINTYKMSRVAVTIQHHHHRHSHHMSQTTMLKIYTKKSAYDRTSTLFIMETPRQADAKSTCAMKSRDEAVHPPRRGSTQRPSVVRRAHLSVVDVAGCVKSGSVAVPHLIVQVAHVPLFARIGIVCHLGYDLFLSLDYDASRFRRCACVHVCVFEGGFVISLGGAYVGITTFIQTQRSRRSL